MPNLENAAELYGLVGKANGRARTLAFFFGGGGRKATRFFYDVCLDVIVYLCVLRLTNFILYSYQET